jgi:asparaginyl-tRNA synthetase
LKVPYPKITYVQAIEKLNKAGHAVSFGKSLGPKEEEILSRSFSSPFWIVGKPRSIEPFPYCIDPNDSRLTVVADLIASKGFGELLGVAEKITDVEELEFRMKEKQKHHNPQYEWLREVHMMGMIPHAAFGMGVERFIRYLIQIPHVRDAIPFPRIFGRTIYP